MRRILRRLALRLVLPRSWRDDRRLAASLQRFADVEADSAWQLLQAQAACPDVAGRAALLADAAEELEHAEGFARLAVRRSAAPLPLLRSARAPLWSGHAATFHARLQVAEAEVEAEFADYARAAPHEDLRAHLESIRQDEAGHAEQAWGAVVRAAGSEAQARRLVRRASWRREWEAFVRAAAVVGDGVSGLLLGLIFFVGGAVLAPLARSRLARGAR